MPRAQLLTVLTAIALTRSGTLPDIAQAAPPLQATPTLPPTDCPPCAPPPPPFEAMQAADATFFGRVVDAQVNSAAGERLEVTFHVTETWTTDTVGERTVVDVPRAVWACGRRPDIGQSWMVYALRDADGRLAIGHCDRSHIADGRGDADANNGLGTGCDPVREFRLAFLPLEVRVGEAFAVQLKTRSLSLTEFTVRSDPPESAVVDPPCPMPCREWRYQFGMRATVAGRVAISVSAFGEDMQCHRSARVWNWTHPMASAAIVIRPAGPPYRVWLPFAMRRSPGDANVRPAVGLHLEWVRRWRVQPLPR